MGTAPTSGVEGARFRQLKLGERIPCASPDLLERCLVEAKWAQGIARAQRRRVKELKEPRPESGRTRPAIPCHVRMREHEQAATTEAVVTQFGQPTPREHVSADSKAQIVDTTPESSSFFQRRMPHCLNDVVVERKEYWAARLG